MRHTLAVLLSAVVLWLAASVGHAQTAVPAAVQPAVDVHVFWRTGCPHCERARTFLQAAAARDRGLRLREYEIGQQAANSRAFVRAVEYFGIQNPGVPTIVVGERHFVGYDADTTTGAAILAAVAACRVQPCADVVPAFFSDAAPARAAGPRPDGLPKTVRLPLLGEVELATVSLPALTVMLAAIDGFNPCAMWTLLFLMGLLVGIPDRTRMWTLGAAFIAASAAVYYVVLAAWLNLLLVLGWVAWIRAVVAMVALAGGGYYIREFFVNPEALCRVTGGASRQRVLAQLRSIALERRFWLALGGIVLLAVAVNLVEFICSAGIPAVYVQVLTLSELPVWQYHAYLLLYILVFMLDDLLIFVIAMKTLQVAGLTGTYARWSHLIGGGLLLVIGVLLLFRPEWLVFG